MRRALRHGPRLSSTLAGGALKIPFAAPVFEVAVRPEAIGRTPVSDFNAALSGLAKQSMHDEVWSKCGDEHLHTPLEGGKYTAANNLFFKAQTNHFFEHRRHLPSFEGSHEFCLLRELFAAAAIEYFERIGYPRTMADTWVERDKLYIWSSVHSHGSTHPAHIHSDSILTGTYYAQTPSAEGDEAAAPLLLDDPRGRSPFDVMIGVESELRYGKGALALDCMPPFDRRHSVRAAAGQLVVFPGWMVHEVPPAQNERVERISFSFNLTGPWEASACPPRVHELEYRPPTGDDAVPEYSGEDEAVATVTQEGAQAEFEAMLRGLGGIKAGATRPSGMPARRPRA